MDSCLTQHALRSTDRRTKRIVTRDKLAIHWSWGTRASVGALSRSLAFVCVQENKPKNGRSAQVACEYASFIPTAKNVLVVIGRDTLNHSFASHCYWLSFQLSSAIVRFLFCLIIFFSPQCASLSHCQNACDTTALTDYRSLKKKNFPFSHHRLCLLVFPLLLLHVCSRQQEWVTGSDFFLLEYRKLDFSSFAIEASASARSHK